MASGAHVIAIGGLPTRPCFSTRQAVTTQDSDADADSAGWSEFRKLLQKYGNAAR